MCCQNKCCLVAGCMPKYSVDLLPSKHQTSCLSVSFLSHSSFLSYLAPLHLKQHLSLTFSTSVSPFSSKYYLLSCLTPLHVFIDIFLCFLHRLSLLSLIPPFPPVLSAIFIHFSFDS